MLHIKVKPIAYKPKGKKLYRKAIMIINRSTANCAIIDCKSMTSVSNMEDYHSLDETEGCTIFKLKR